MHISSYSGILTLCCCSGCTSSLCISSLLTEQTPSPKYSFCQTPSGIFNFCIQSKYKLVGLSGRTSCHPSLRNLYLGKRKSLQKWLTVLAKFVSSPVHWYSSRTFLLLCRLAIFDLDISNSKDLISLSFSSIIFNKSRQERLISSSAFS